MNELSKKLSYVKGFADGLGLSTDSAEGKVIVKLLELLDDAAAKIEELEERLDGLEEITEELDDVIYEMADDVYDDEDDEDLFGEDGKKDFDMMDDLFDEDYDEDDDESDVFEIQCPACGDDVTIDFDMIEGDEPIICPNCREEIELDLNFDDDEDEDED